MITYLEVVDIVLSTNPYDLNTDMGVLYAFLLCLMLNVRGGHAEKTCGFQVTEKLIIYCTTNVRLVENV